MKHVIAMGIIASWVALVFGAALVSAQPPGTPPDLHCAVTDTIPAGFDDMIGGFPKMDVDPQAGLYAYYGFIDSSPNTVEFVLAKYDRDCSQVWSRNPTANCPMTNTDCLPVGVVNWLRNGTVSILVQWSGASPFTAMAWYAANNGTFLGSQDLAAVGLTNSCCRGNLPIYTANNDTSVDAWVFGDDATDQLVKTDPNVTGAEWTVGLTQVSMFDQLRGTNSNFVCVYRDSTSSGVSTYSKINLTTGASAGSFEAARFSGSVTATEDCGAPSLTDDTVLYSHRFSSAEGEPRVLQVNVTSWAIDQIIEFDDAQIDAGSGPATTQTHDRLIDVDRNDALLICGVVANTPTASFVAQFNSTEPGAAQQWNRTFSVSGESTRSADSCRLDFVSGLWWVGDWFDSSTSGFHNVAFRRYVGGDFNQPEAPAFITESGDVAATTPAPTVDAGGGIVNFATSIGFQSTGSQFLFGLVLVIIAMVVVAAAIKSFSEGQPVMLAAGVAAVGMSIFNASIGLWAAWTTVVLVIIAAGIVAFIIRRGVFGFGQSGG